MKSATNALRLRVREHARHLRLDAVGRHNCAARRRREQHRVRHRPPEEVRQPVRHLVVAQLDDGAVLDCRPRIHLPVVEEAGRLQHRLDQQDDRAVEVERQRRAARVVEVVSVVVSAVVSGRRNAFAPKVVMNMPAQPASADALAGVQAGSSTAWSTCSSPAPRRRPAHWPASSVPIAVGWRNGKALLLRSSDSPGTSSTFNVVSFEQIADGVQELARGETPRRHEAGGVRVGRDRRRSAAACRHVAGRPRDPAAAQHRVGADRSVARDAEQARAADRGDQKTRRRTHHDVRTLQSEFLAASLDGNGRLHQKLHTPTSRTPLRDSFRVCALI